LISTQDFFLGGLTIYPIQSFGRKDKSAKRDFPVRLTGRNFHPGRKQTGKPNKTEEKMG